jgi:hypothetical protein
MKNGVLQLHKNFHKWSQIFINVIIIQHFFIARPIFYFIFDKLRAFRHEGRERHSNLVGISILPRPSLIAHIIINKKEKKVYTRIGGT